MTGLLLDENFPAPAARRLREMGHDIVEGAAECTAWPDERVLERAVTEHRWLITFDRDYGDLVFKRRLPAPPVIVLLREAHYRPAEPADWLLPLLGEAERHVGRFLVVTRDKVRWRALLQPV
jgi:predicted nuclease of predicted toxin-antitoxin system